MNNSISHSILPTMLANIQRLTKFLLYF